MDYDPSEIVAVPALGLTDVTLIKSIEEIARAAKKGTCPPDVTIFKSGGPIEGLSAILDVGRAIGIPSKVLGIQ